MTPYHPASNGAAERTVQTVKRALIKQMLDPKKRELSIYHKLANFSICYRNTPQSTTGRTPAELFLRRHPRTRFSLLKPNLAQKVKENQEKQSTTTRVELRNECLVLELGQRVRVKSNVGGLIKWFPGKVIKVCGPRTYLVHMYGNGKTRFVHIDHVLKSEEIVVGDSEVTPTVDFPQPCPLVKDTSHSTKDLSQSEGIQVESKQTEVQRGSAKTGAQGQPVLKNPVSENEKGKDITSVGISPSTQERRYPQNS